MRVRMGRGLGCKLKRKFFSFQIAFVNSQVYSGNNYMHRAKKPDAYNLEKVVAAKPVNEPLENDCYDNGRGQPFVYAGIA